ncbi:hypothetical protein [Flavobacterium anhuiense]|nr:hypothetical protein [Flavobacterium anhuiense]
MWLGEVNYLSRWGTGTGQISTSFLDGLKQLAYYYVMVCLPLAL